MVNKAEMEALFIKHEYTDFKWINPKDIIVSQWVRMKCMFGCDEYGRNAACPPNVPPVSECRQFFNEYNLAAIFHFEKKCDKPEDRHAWTRAVNQELLKLERAIFLAGFQKAFLVSMDSCTMCADCSGVREKCKNPKSARPTPEGLAVDVYSTVRQCGYPIQVLSDYSQTMNRYAFLLIE
jgi:predicted metal-binding protein